MRRQEDSIRLVGVEIDYQNARFRLISKFSVGIMRFNDLVRWFWGGFWQVFVAVGLTMWVEVARLVRGLVKSTKEELFIQAGIALGFSKLRLLIHHILPILIAPLIVISTVNFASAILMESGLSFLGIGAQPPMPSWGGMVKDHFRYPFSHGTFLCCRFEYAGPGRGTEPAAEAQAHGLRVGPDEDCRRTVWRTPSSSTLV